MGRLAYIDGLGSGILLVDYTRDFNSTVSDDRFEAMYSKEEVMNTAMDQDTQVNKILHVTKEGLVAQLTISFENGKLDLVRKPKPNPHKLGENHYEI